MAFPERFLQELTERNDIVDVVSSYVKLTKRTGANLFGLCPFHSEKTPSFSVAPDKQIYYCFGCGKGGSVINFIMEVENLSFPDAVAFLARRAGMAIPEEEGSGEGRKQRERMLSLNRDAARFFFEQLISPAGRPAQAYVERRGISPAMVKAFGLGFAPDSWDTLVSAMTAKGYSQKELAEAGLAKHRQKGGGVYDAFRNRLMFPVIDVRGSVIGFSGRILGDGEPKYLNSPETLVFNKSRNLFALNLAKKSKSGYIILSEGNIDVVALHQAGFDCAVASLGTSLTAEQARLLSRYTNQIIIAYDNDGAGQKAAQRAIGIFEKLDMRVRVLKMEGAKDPDEFIKAKGADAFRQLIEQSENQVEYRLGAVTAKYDLGTDEGKVGFLKEAAGLLAELPGSVEREVYAMRVAEMAGVSKDATLGEVARLRKVKFNSAKKTLEREALRPARTAQPVGRALHYENVRSAAAEEGILRLLCLEPALFQGRVLPQASDFSAPVLGCMFEELLRRAGQGDDMSIAALAGSFTPEEISHLTGILQKPEDLSAADKALSDYIDIIMAEKERRESAGDLRAIAEKYRGKKGYGGQI
jgi:DNA primase